MGKRQRQEEEEEEEELEIDLSQPRPPSKKELRRLKKIKESRGLQGDLDEIWKSQKAAKKSVIKQQEKKSKYGIWIGNLDYSTTKNDIREWLISNCQEISGDKDISRLHLPLKDKHNKGFAYVDFQTPEQLKSALLLSDTHLQGRRVLIKDATSFEGRPEKQEVDITSKTLFVGNLPFDTTEEQLEVKFGKLQSSKISRIRMATFQDNPHKCKGFAFIDFDSVDGPTHVIRHVDRFTNWKNGRKLRLEAGQDRSKMSRRPPPREVITDNGEQDESSSSLPSLQQEPQSPPPQTSTKRQPKPKPKPKNPTPGQILAQAPRASAGIVATTGKKIVF